jgi:hypothetical protein
MGKACCVVALGIGVTEDMNSTDVDIGMARIANESFFLQE